MSYTRDSALLVPAGGDAELYEWLHGLEAVAVAPAIPSAAKLAERFDLVRVEALSAFWEEDGVGSLTKRFGEFFSGLALAGTAILVAVVRDGVELDFVVGVDRGAGASAAALVGSSLRGARVRHLEGSENAKTRASVLNACAFEPARVALLGTPASMRSPKDIPLVERLAASPVTRWSLVLRGEPVDSEALVQRALALGAANREIGGRLGGSIRTTGTETRQFRDPALEQLAQLLTREERRSLDGVNRGAFLVECWLGAEDQGSARLLGAIAATTLSSAGTEPLPLRLAEPTPGGQAPGAVLLGSELAAIVQPPLNDVPGFAVRSWARFDEEPERLDRGSRVVRLGRTRSGVELTYPVDALSSHSLVTGATGSGKTSFVFGLLEELHGFSPPVPFLVIEPVKLEYERLPLEGLGVWAIGDPAGDDQWRLNPLEVPAGTPVQTHIDLLMALFRSTFSLFPPLPYILEMGLRALYARRGWDLATSRNLLLEADADHPAQPCLSELIEVCSGLVDELGYGGEVRDNVKAALSARLGSLTAGSKGVLFDTEEPFAVDRLLSSPWVVNLDRIGNDEEKAFVTGLLLIRLLEARQRQNSRSLVHVTVLEEAHRILKRSTSDESSDGARHDFAVETFGGLLAEVRAAGEGIVIVDQSPRKLATDALANTALKVAFRTPFGEDKESLTAALNLDEAQLKVLTGLAPHEAAVFWEGMDRPVLGEMARTFSGDAPERLLPSAQPRLLLTPDAASSRLARTMLSANREERPEVGRELRQRVRDSSTRELGPDDVETAVAEQLRSAVEAVGRHRLWPLRRRDAVLRHLLTDGSEGEDPRELLIDGSLPHTACPAACPNGGCLVREIGARAGDILRERGFDRITNMPTDLLRSELDEVVVEAMGTVAAPSAQAVALGCCVVHAFGEDDQPRRVAELVRRVRSEPRG